MSYGFMGCSLWLYIIQELFDRSNNYPSSLLLQVRFCFSLSFPGESMTNLNLMYGNYLKELKEFLSWHLRKSRCCILQMFKEPWGSLKLEQFCSSQTLFSDVNFKSISHLTAWLQFRNFKVITIFESSGPVRE